MEVEALVSDGIESREWVGSATQLGGNHPRSNSPRLIEVTLDDGEPKLASDDLHLARTIHPVWGEKMPEPSCFPLCQRERTDR